MSANNAPLSPGIKLINSLPSRHKPVCKVDWSPDGRLLAVCYDDLIELWDVESISVIQGFSPAGKVLDCTWANGGDTFAYLSRDAMILYDLAGRSADTQLSPGRPFVVPSESDLETSGLWRLTSALLSTVGSSIVGIGAVPTEAKITALFSNGVLVDMDAVSGEPLRVRMSVYVQELARIQAEEVESALKTARESGDVEDALSALSIVDLLADLYDSLDDEELASTTGLESLIGHIAGTGRVAWAPAGAFGTSLHGNGIQVFPADSSLVETLADDRMSFTSAVWQPSQEILIAASEEAIITYWDPRNAKMLEVLEGHADAITGVTVSSDGRYIASKSLDDTIRIWRFDKRDTVAVINEKAGATEMAPIAFHPRRPLLASVDGDNQQISLWELDTDHLAKAASVSRTVHYVNAKIVLIGDTGVGKTGLARVLTGRPFKATLSTHGRQVWEFDKRTILNAAGQMETHEAVLWDFAGQPGYRIVHQLHLGDVAVALVVFDARNELDPFAGVRHWGSALQKVQRVKGDGAFPMHKLLVAARSDRGRVSVSRERLDQMVQDGGFDAYIETSAMDDRNIKELSAAIRLAIDWQNLPRVSSTRLFTQIKNYLINQKNSGKLLVSVSELYQGFLKMRAAPPDSEELQDQFDVCVGRVEAVDLVRRLSFGDLVLLKPELLDAYASALVNAAREEPDGLGFVTEENAREGDFTMSGNERVQETVLEKLLLIATVKDLLWHEIALREESEDGAILVFPSQLTRENPSLPNPPGKFITFRFVGPLQSIYATLVVRLTRSSLFAQDTLWRNAAQFAAAAGGRCGLYLDLLDEDMGEIILFADDLASEETRFYFEDYVQQHLGKRALSDSVQRRRLFICPNPACQVPVTDAQAEKRRELGHDWIRCNVCDTVISLKDRLERLERPPRPGTMRMDEAADLHRHRQTIETTLQGNVVTGELNRCLYSRFTMAGIEELCFLLGVEYEDVRSRTKKQTVIALVKYMERRSRLVDLLKTAIEQRPEADWSSLLPERMPG